MIFRITNKGKTVVQCQLIGGASENVQPGSVGFVDSAKVFRRELDRLGSIPGVRATEYAKTLEEAEKKNDDEIKSRDKSLEDANKKAAAEAKEKAEKEKKAAEEKAKADEKAVAEKAKADAEARKKAEGGNR